MQAALLLITGLVQLIMNRHCPRDQLSGSRSTEQRLLIAYTTK